MYLASDALALAAFTDRAHLSRGWRLGRPVAWPGRVSRCANAPVDRPKLQDAQASALLVEKGNYRHFMAKEIHEQPEVVGAHAGSLSRHVGGRGALPFELPFDPRS